MSNSNQSREEKRQRWEGILTEQAESGLSAAAFCRERGLSYQTFGYWKKRLRGTTSAEGAPEFREICTIGQPMDLGYLEIVLGGIVIRVPPRFEESDLRRVLSLVAGPSC